MEDNQVDDVDDPTKVQKQQAPSSQAASYSTELSGKPDSIAKATKRLAKKPV
jgi:hypothetical protein